ncbi:MAG: DegT/DnrJ/EryC1/StrS family aminotransferase [Candidatus Moduliflexus flocculans]|nr:DegT/DnrJ/EryC1/StrS family aminotransferase [Candidatus Moduliflexus flocculans]
MLAYAHLHERPAPERTVAFHSPWFDETELEAVREALSGRVAGDGPVGRRVESLLAERMGARRVLLTTSGTHALELALLALGVGPGQEVICPSFTSVSSANAILRVGARPVFAEIEEATLGLDADDVERRVTPHRGRAPRALRRDRARHGGPPRRGPPAPPANGRGRGPGPRRLLARRALGTIGDAGCLSFHETKNVTCGEAGRPRPLRPGGGAAGRDRPGEGHEPGGVSPRRGGQVHVGRGGQQLRALRPAGRGAPGPARQARRDPGAPGGGRRRATARRSPAGPGAGREAPARAPGEDAEPPHLLPALPGREAPRRGPAGPARAGRSRHLPLRPVALGPARPERSASTASPSPVTGWRERSCACPCTRSSPARTWSAWWPRSGRPGRERGALT